MIKSNPKQLPIPKELHFDVSNTGKEFHLRDRPETIAGL
jgi:hypothetical protein